MSRVLPFGFAGYRSFGPEAQRVVAGSRVNLIAGPNNSGKSNIIHFLKDQYNAALKALPEQQGRRGQWDLSGHDVNQGSHGRKQFSIGLEVQGPEYQRLVEDERLRRQFRSRLEDVLTRLFHLPSMHRDGVLWFTYGSEQGDPNRMRPLHFDSVAEDGNLSPREWNELSEGLDAGRGYDPRAWINNVLTRISPKPEPIKVEIVPAIRRVGPKDSVPEDYGGSGLLRRLQSIQSPTLDQYALKARFQEITDFVRRLLRDSEASIEVPHDLSTVIVTHGGRRLPLELLGTGVHEVIILAVAATTLTDHVVCIEEPELHLHPLMQRQLLEYLANHTDNQYFITTHSAALLDMRLGRIHGTRLDEGMTTVRTIRDPRGQFTVCRELGYQASDLLQSNCVIWVEGPSDRILVSHWISETDPDLVEGIHYSVMFYGGRLLSHLSAQDPELTDFISLARLNRNMAVIIDSDRNAPRAKINATKRRIRDEVTAAGGFVWITKGREIENYIPAAQLREQVLSVSPSAKLPRHLDEYSDVFATSGRGGSRIDKVRLAHRVASVPMPAQHLDLTQQVRALVRFVRDANDL